MLKDLSHSLLRVLDLAEDIQWLRVLFVIILVDDGLQIECKLGSSEMLLKSFLAAYKESFVKKN